MASSLVSLLTVSNNVLDVHKAGPGNIVTFTVTYNTVVLGSITGTCNNTTLVFTQVGSSATYTSSSYVVQKNDVQGAPTFSITADTVTSTAVTDANDVIVDTIPPSAIITYTSTGVVTSPKIGDTHTINLVVSEQLHTTPKLNFGHLQTTRIDNKTININPSFIWTQIDSVTWQGTYKLTGYESFPKSFLINLSDLTGNISYITYTFFTIRVLDFKVDYYFFDHFINKMHGRFYSNDAGNFSIVSPILREETGIIKFQVSTTPSYAGYNISENFSTFLNEAYLQWWVNVRISDLSNLIAGDDAIIRIGFVDHDAAEPTYGLYFESNAGTNSWQTCIAVNGTRTKHNISSIYNILKSGSVYAERFGMHYVNGAVNFYIDGVLIDTIPYAISDPVAAGAFPSLGIVFKKNDGISANYLNVDYLEFYGKNSGMNTQAYDYNDDFNNDFFS